MRRLLATAAILASASTLLAEPPAKPADPVPTPAAPLSGPKVETKRPADSGLVKYTFDGKVQRLEQPPELAAIDLIKPDKAAREKLEALMVRRAKVLDDFVADNLPMLTEFQTVSAARDKAGFFKLAGAASRKLEELWKDGSLQSQVRAALAPADHDRYDQLVADYWNAIVAERRADPADVDERGKQKNRLAILVEERFKSLGKEIEKSFYRVVQSGELIYRYLFKGIDLSPDQSARLRTICADFSRETMLQPNKEQGEKFFRDVSRVLDAEQRKEAIARFVKVIKGK